ncbi:flagellar basal body P-ring formation chaperone FlgA [Luteimonas notoginsengisoli]|uniref:Flagella basal body P-ring formation protein FlgA n=1 Tax=Luteimonas notoginsengisoli TaxID=1578200 RepID=A0ABV7UNL7_9GAMM
MSSIASIRRRPAGRPGPALAGAVLAVGVLLGAMPAGRARAAVPTQPLDDIGAAAIAALGAGDAQSAEAVLDPALRLARCSQPLQAVASGAKTAQVRCDDTPGWRLYVPVRVHREADVVVLATPAASGVPIAANQLVVQRRDIGDAAGATFSDPAALVGRIPNQALAPGVVPTEADLAVGRPLRRGDPVVLVSRTGGVEVRMPGRALGPARAGGMVQVENASSRRVLRGRMAEEGVVELLP